MFLALSTSKHYIIPPLPPTTSRVVRTSVIRLCYFPRGTLHAHTCTSRLHFVFLEKTAAATYLLRPGRKHVRAMKFQRPIAAQPKPY